MKKGFPLVLFVSLLLCSIYDGICAEIDMKAGEKGTISMCDTNSIIFKAPIEESESLEWFEGTVPIASAANKDKYIRKGPFLKDDGKPVLLNIKLNSKKNNITTTSERDIEVYRHPSIKKVIKGCEPIVETPSYLCALDIDVDRIVSDTSLPFWDKATGFEWDFGDESPNVTTKQVLHKFDSAGVYKVIATAANGDCSDKQLIYLKVGNLSNAEKCDLHKPFDTTTADINQKVSYLKNLTEYYRLMNKYYVIPDDERGGAQAM